MEEYKGKELIIMACSQCNINCSHCYISYEGNREPEELLKIVKKLKQKYDININGAEVLTNPLYLESYKEIGQEFIMTNGKVFLYDKNICQKLKQNRIRSISLSYHFGIQDDLSRINEQELRKIINIIKDNKFEFRLLTTITSENYKELAYMCSTAKELGAKGIKFTNLLKQGNGKKLSYNSTLNQQQINEFFELLEQEREKYDINELLIERCGTFGKNKISNHDNFNCDCISDSIVLTPDNNIYPCVFLAQPGYEIGKFINDKLYVNDEYINNHDECLAHSACNEHKKVLIKKGVRV